MEQKEDERPELQPADLPPRIVAFSIDLALFYAAYFASLRLFFGARPTPEGAGSIYWLPIWGAAFLAYQAWFSSEGRQSLGKRLLGLRVVDLDQEPLSLGQSMIRSGLYVVSSVLNLGFLWALLNPAKQCWHDLAIGSIVISDGRPRWSPALVRVAAALCLVVAAGQWYWNAAVRERYDNVMSVAYAQVGMQELATLQRHYHRRHGRYANSLLSLAPLSGAPEVFLSDMRRLYGPSGIKIKGDKTQFTIQARAADDGRTLIAFKGP